MITNEVGQIEMAGREGAVPGSGAPVPGEPGPEAPGSDPADPCEPRMPPSEPADAWALERARRELDGARARAALAEEQRAAEARRADELERGLGAARAALEESERRRSLDQALFEQGATDVEVARLLAERAMSGGTDAAAAVREVRRRRPHLFGTPGRDVPVGVSAGWELAEDGASAEELAGASVRARATGDREAVLRYLRLKRGV